MLESRVIEVNGIFVGTAVASRECGGWRFVAADSRAMALDGSVSPTFDEARRLARQAYLGVRPSAERQPVAAET